MGRIGRIAVVTFVALSTIGLGIVVPLSGTSGAASTSGPLLKIAPGINLHGGSAVKVSGSGLPPSTNVYLVECVDVATDASGCSLSVVGAGSTSTSGTLAKTTFDVISGNIGNGTCGTSAGDDDACKIVLIDGSDTPLAAAPISFGPTVTVSPSVGLGDGPGDLSHVTVNATGLTPFGTYEILECVGPQTASGCSILYQTMTANSAGTTVPELVTVQSFVPGGECSNLSPSLFTENLCEIVVQNVNNASDAGAAVISFPITNGQWLPEQVSAVPKGVIPGPLQGTEGDLGFYFHAPMVVQNGQTVSIVGWSLVPSVKYQITECLTTVTPETANTGCDASTTKEAKTTSSGALATTFKVYSGNIGNGTCGTASNDAYNCMIVLLNPATSNIIPITFGFGL